MIFSMVMQLDQLIWKASTNAVGFWLGLIILDTTSLLNKMKWNRDGMGE